MADKATDIFGLERRKSQRPSSKTPLQKLANEEPVDRPGRLGQPRYLVQVSIIFLPQSLDTWGVWNGFNYAEVAGGYSPLSFSMRIYRALHGGRRERKLSTPRHASSYLISPPNKRNYAKRAKLISA